MVRQQELSSTYKKLIVSVLLILLMIGGVVIYFSLNRVEITVFPKLITKQTQFFMDVRENADGASADILKGTIEKIEVEHSGTFDASGEKEVTADGELPVVGKVTLYNEQNSAQTLIRKTRLLSAENNLFRLTEAVSIPAGGSVEAEVYFDPEENNFMTQSASKFTIRVWEKVCKAWCMPRVWSRLFVRETKLNLCKRVILNRPPKN